MRCALACAHGRADSRASDDTPRAAARKRADSNEHSNGTRARPRASAASATCRSFILFLFQLAAASIFSRMAALDRLRTCRSLALAAAAAAIAAAAAADFCSLQDARAAAAMKTENKKKTCRRKRMNEADCTCSRVSASVTSERATRLASSRQKARAFADIDYTRAYLALINHAARAAAAIVATIECEHFSLDTKTSFFMRCSTFCFVIDHFDSKNACYLCHFFACWQCLHTLKLKFQRQNNKFSAFILLNC